MIMCTKCLLRNLEYISFILLEMRCGSAPIRNNGLLGRLRIQEEYDAAIAQRKIDKAQAVKGAPRLQPIPKPKFHFPKPAKPIVLPQLSKASGHISKKNGVRFNVRGVEVSDDAVGTYLNPFDVAKPWITKRTLTGKYYYVHEVTLERRETPPGMSVSATTS